MKTINLPAYGIEITLGDPDPESPSRYLGGSIKSDLKDDNRQSRYNAAIDALESLILAHACAGVDVESDAYLEGINTTCDAIFNNLT
ncbi:MAG: hypothetical protein HC888_05400 [Candidatus Competibacteraceae bacterium]|nr:hypothetical protein [Candidatus Competibacteraceae bacterium]